MHGIFRYKQEGTNLLLTVSQLIRDFTIIFLLVIVQTKFREAKSVKGQHNMTQIRNSDSPRLKYLPDVCC